MSTTNNEPVVSSYAQAPTRTISASGVTYAYRELGPNTALGFDKVDIFSFSLGGMVAQALVAKHPGLVRKLVLTGTGPAGGRASTRSPEPLTSTRCGRP